MPGRPEERTVNTKLSEAPPRRKDLSRATYVLAVWEAELDRFHTYTAHDRASVDFALETTPQGVAIFAFEVDTDAETLEPLASAGVGGRRRTDADLVQSFAAHARWCAAMHAGFPLAAVERAVWGSPASDEAVAASESDAA